MRIGRIRREQRKLAAAPDSQRPVHTGLILTGPIRREQRKLAAPLDSQRPEHTGLVLCAPESQRPMPVVQLVRLLTSSSELRIR